VTAPRLAEPSDAEAPLRRGAVAEFLGTGLLVAVIVGSGIAAARLSPYDQGLQLLESSVATALGLFAIIALFGPISAHINPVITLAALVLGPRWSPARSAVTVVSQCAGAIGGALLANAMFGVAQGVATTARASAETILAEIVATAGLVLLVFVLVRTGRAGLVAPAVGAYIGAAYWFTPSTSFANPAVTLGRVFSDTFAGIEPGSAVAFVTAQLVGGAVGVLLTLLLVPKGRP